MKEISERGPGRLSRREFNALTAIGVGAAALGKGEGVSAMEGPEVKVSLAGVPPGSSAETLALAVRAAAAAATDFSWLKKGDSVYLKPAHNSGNPYPATTSPAGAAAMIKLLKEKGAGRVIVADTAGVQYVKLNPNDQVRGSTRKLMEQSGLARAALAAGAELYFPEEAGWKAFLEDGPVSGSHWKAGIMVPALLKEVDHLVLMPRTSRHVLAGATLGLKTVVGYMRTDSRLEYHRDADSFFEKTAEANTIPALQDKLRLILSVATQVQTTYGPDQGHVVTPETGLVFASTSLVAHDMVSLAWLLHLREQTPAFAKKGLKDPHQYAAAVAFANRAVVYLLGGAGEMARAHTLRRQKLTSVSDDQVLNRAYQVFGGRPRLKLEPANADLPESLRQKLGPMTAAG